MNKEFVGINGGYFKFQGRFFFPVGVNYLSSIHDCRMWREWDPVELSADFAKMKQLGINTARIFFFWNDLEPRPGKYNSLILSRFAAIVKLAKKNQILLHPSLLNGTLAAPQWTPAWAIGKSIYSGEMIARLGRLAQWLVKRFKDEPQIFAWDVSNEPAYWEEPKDPEWSAHWVRKIITAIRAVDKNHLVTVGLDQHNINGESRFEVEPTVSCQDFVCTHTYLRLLADNEGALAFRSTYFHGYAVKFSRMKKPVLLQEFGLSTGANSEQEQKCFYEMALYSSLLNGAAGVLPWSWRDELRCDRHPYNQRFPMSRYGIIRLDGVPKPAAFAMRKFGRLIRDFSAIVQDQAQVAIVLPPNIYNVEVSKWVFNAFILSKMAGLDPEIIRAGENISGYKLLVLPNFFGHKYTLLDEFEDFVKKGGTIYCSLGPGYIPLRRLEKFVKEILGLELSSSPINDPENKKITVTFFPRKLTLKYESPRKVCYHPFIKGSGKVLASDSSGKPALILNHRGRGTVISSILPLENFLANKPLVYEKGDETYRIYGYAAELAGVNSFCQCLSPYIEIGGFRGGNRPITLAINHTDKNISTIIIKKGKEIPINFLPFEIKMLGQE